jgi:23S rRNA pseudouridine955/2504/2580 synthase/23S rRNA pseudouridine1911/1915/1917 synthase
MRSTAICRSASSFRYTACVTAKADLDVLWSDGQYVAVLKPAGLATIPGRAETDSVLEQLGRQIGLPSSGTVDPRIRVVHRLDKDTSGVLIFAKDVAAQRHLSRQFQNNLVEKEYLAIVCGRPNETEGIIDAALARHPASPQRMAIVRHGGRSARTAWRIEQTYRNYSLLRVFPKTGKTHQIRVHLKMIGHPLAVDPLYNTPLPGRPEGIYLSSFKRHYRPAAGQQERPLIDRLTLHAERIRFNLPDGNLMELVAPLPKDMRSAIHQLQRHGSG